MVTEEGLRKLREELGTLLTPESADLLMELLLDARSYHEYMRRVSGGAGPLT